MAAAGTLSRPTSAQGSYGPFQTYYPPSSPTISSPGYGRPTSAASNYVSDNYSTYRKPVSVRPATPRHSTSTQHIPSITPSSPTRIYGHRNLSKSSEDVQRLGQQTHPVQSLQRNYTAPDLRHRASPQRNRPYATGRTTRGPHDNLDLKSTNVYETESLSDISTHPTHANSRAHIRSLSSPTDSDGAINLEVVQELAAPSAVIVDNRIAGSDFDRYNLPRPRSGRDEVKLQSTRGMSEGGEASINQSSNHESLTASDRAQDASSQISIGKPVVSLQEAASSVMGVRKFSPVTTSRSEDHTPLQTPDRPQDATKTEQFADNVGDAIDERKQDRLAEASLPPRANTPVPANYTSQETGKSLKDRLRRALSFSSRSELASSSQSDMPTGRTPKESRGLFAQNNKSTDNISISSTASSASLLLRKMGHGFSKKTKRSINGIFSGSRTKLNADAEKPVVGNINYINAEARSDHHSYSRPTSDVAAQSPAQHSMVSLSGRTNIPVGTEITEAVSNVDGHGSVAFPRLSEEIVVEEDRSRRASMHLERPLPIDLAIKNSPKPAMSGVRSVSMPSLSTNMSASIYTGKGILKKTLDPMQGQPLLLPMHDTLPTAKDLPESDAFDISFAPTPTFDLGGFTTPEQARSRRTSIGHSGHFSPPAHLGTSPQSLTFCPRITIHETYTAMEYDRRGDIATCNRLTPLLAQRIKEELNAYKMDEMDVADESRVHTHFFT